MASTEKIIRSFFCTLLALHEAFTFIREMLANEFILVVHQIKLQYIAAIGVKM